MTQMRAATRQIEVTIVAASNILAIHGGREMLFDGDNSHDVNKSSIHFWRICAADVLGEMHLIDPMLARLELHQDGASAFEIDEQKPDRAWRLKCCVDGSPRRLSFLLPAARRRWPKIGRRDRFERSCRSPRAERPTSSPHPFPRR